MFVRRRCGVGRRLHGGRTVGSAHGIPRLLRFRLQQPNSRRNISVPPARSASNSYDTSFDMRFVVGPGLTWHARRRSEEPWTRPPTTEFRWGRVALRGGARRSFVDRLVNPVASVAAVSIQAPIEYFRVRRIVGDGRCLFRALAQGVSRHKSIYLTPVKEEREADNLRMAVQEALCTSKTLKHEFRDVIQTLEEPLNRYCKKLKSPSFWGGEPELLVLSQLLRTPIHVYKKETEFGSVGMGFVKIVEYGRDAKNVRYPPVRLLYSGSNHYDLLLD